MLGKRQTRSSRIHGGLRQEPSSRTSCSTASGVSRGRKCPAIGTTRRSCGPVKNAVVALRLPRWRDAIAVAMQDNRRDRDYGLFHKLGLDGLECGLTLRRPVSVWVGMDRNFDKIKAGRLR